MSKVQVDSIVNKDDNGAPSFPKGVTITGIITTNSLSMGGQLVSTLGVGIRTTGSISGYGATMIDFRGSGISTVTVGSGIATVNIESVGGVSYSTILGLS